MWILILGLAHVLEQFSQSTEPGVVSPGPALQRGNSRSTTGDSTVRSIASCLHLWLSSSPWKWPSSAADVKLAGACDLAASLRGALNTFELASALPGLCCCGRLQLSWGDQALAINISYAPRNPWPATLCSDLSTPPTNTQIRHRLLASLF